MNKKRTKIDQMYFNIISQKDSLSPTEQFYVYQLKHLMNNYKKLQTSLNKELKGTCLDQKEVGTIIKNITQINSMIINILNLFDTTEEQEWKGLDF